MDKETLSNYGWIVIAVLVLVVMIALATPFGNFVRDAIVSTTEGLFGVNQTALDSVNIIIDDQSLNFSEIDIKNLSGGLFVPGTKRYIDIDVNGKQVDATWANLIEGDYIKVVDNTLSNGTRVSEMYGELVVCKEIVAIANAAWNSGDYFLSDSNITSIVFEEGVTKIGSFTLAFCNTIESVNIPSSVKNINEGFCFQCKNLKNISVSENNPNFKSVDGVLYSKDMKTLIKYPANKNTDIYYIPDGTEIIKPFAFRYCKIKNIYFPDSLTTVGQQSFEG